MDKGPDENRVDASPLPLDRTEIIDLRTYVGDFPIHIELALQPRSKCREHIVRIAIDRELLDLAIYPLFQSDGAGAVLFSPALFLLVFPRSIVFFSLSVLSPLFSVQQLLIMLTGRDLVCHFF